MAPDGRIMFAFLTTYQGLKSVTEVAKGIVTAPASEKFGRNMTRVGKTSVNMAKAVDLFELQMPEARLHTAFRELKGSGLHSEARALMNALYTRMGDPNGNFVKDFQSDGFHSRLFELACFAYIEEGGFNVDRSHPSPDFVVTAGNGTRIAIEATTANPSSGRTTDISIRCLENLSQEDIAEKVEREFPRRMYTILKRKLAHNYHELAHCRDIPLVLSVAPFFEAGAVFYTDESLLPLLYGVGDSAEESTAFFDLPEAASISGLLYCNAFTVPRFLRMATGWDKVAAETVAHREGVCYRPDGESAPYQFRYRMGHPDTPAEFWGEGVTLFVNPNARILLPDAALPCTCTFSVEGPAVVRRIHGFHPVVSFMLISVDGNVAAATDVPL